MNKNNRFTLIATVLLGVLLYTIIRFAGDLDVAWDGGMREPPPADEAPALPRIASTADLHAFLDGQGLDADALIAGLGAWRSARGFTGPDRLFGNANVAAETLSEPDNAELRARSAAGDAAATQAIAAAAVFNNLAGALELYREAAEQGSTFALLRLASLLESLAAAGGGPEIAVNLIGDDLKLTALGYVLAAVRDGGAPIIDAALLDWLDRLNAGAAGTDRAAACEWSERTLVDIARARVRREQPAITTAPPPVFFAIPGLAERLPCKDTSFPIESLLDLSSCTTTPVVNAAGDPLDLHLCKN